MSDLYNQRTYIGQQPAQNPLNPASQAANSSVTGEDPNERALRLAQKQFSDQSAAATDREEKRRLLNQALEVQGYLNTPNRGPMPEHFQGYLPQKPAEAPTYDEKNPTFASTLGLFKPSTPAQTAIVKQLATEKNPIARQKMLDQLANTADSVQAAHVGALQRLNESYQQPDSMPQMMGKIETIQKRDQLMNYVPDRAGPPAAPQTAAAPSAPQTAAAPSAPVKSAATGQGPQSAQGAQTKTPDDMRKKLYTTVNQLKNTKDPKAWWEILAAIADVAAAGFKGATGQGHVTQAQRDMMAKQEMESARQLTAEQFQNAMAVQEYEADLQRQRDERQAATNKELAQMGYGYDAQQSAAQRQLQRDLAAQQNLPPIAPAF